MSHIIPRSSGVYQIQCIPTGKIYIGSATNLRERWRHHVRSLRSDSHKNAHLQHAWLKYGENAFTFSVLEYVERSQLLESEQAWIDRTSCTDKDIGFNIYSVAGSPGQIRAKVWEGFVNPQGEKVSITNLFDFCHQNDLDFSSMHRLAGGKSKLKSYKGWTHQNSIRQRDYIKSYEGFIDPNGNEVGTITNLAEFCRHHNIDKTHMVAVANGRLLSHQGWTHINGRARKEHKIYVGFVNPSGELVTIQNLTEFCRNNALHPVKMFNLKSGKIPRYRGWIWRKETHND